MLQTVITQVFTGKTGTTRHQARMLLSAVTVPAQQYLSAVHAKPSSTLRKQTPKGVLNNNCHAIAVLARWPHRTKTRGPGTIAYRNRNGALIATKRSTVIDAIHFTRRIRQASPRCFGGNHNYKLEDTYTNHNGSHTWRAMGYEEHNEWRRFFHGKMLGEVQ